MNGYNLEAEDPRLIDVKDKIFILFNIKNPNVYLGRYMCISEYDNFNPIVLRIIDMPFNHMEKNWSPFVKNNKLYFVYNYDPLIILHYDFNPYGICDIVFKQNNISLPIDTGQTYLRGGTNLVHYKNDYYISLCHSRIGTDRFGPHGYRYYYYFSFIIILNTKDWKIEYLSKPLLYEYNNDDLIKIKNTNILFDEDPYRCVISPTSINKIKENEFIITLNVGDRMPLNYKLFTKIILQKNNYDINYWNNKTKELSIDLINNCSEHKYKFF
jgi:hypothetical protein